MHFLLFLIVESLYMKRKEKGTSKNEKYFWKRQIQNPNHKKVLHKGQATTPDPYWNLKEYNQCPANTTKVTGRLLVRLLANHENEKYKWKWEIFLKETNTKPQSQRTTQKPSHHPLILTGTSRKIASPLQTQ